MYVRFNMYVGMKFEETYQIKKPQFSAALGNYLNISSASFDNIN